VGQHSADLPFHKQGYELSDLRVVKPGMHGLDNPLDVNRRNIGVGRCYPRHHLGDLRSFVYLPHGHSVHGTLRGPGWWSSRYAAWGWRVVVHCNADLGRPPRRVPRRRCSHPNFATRLRPEPSPDTNAALWQTPSPANHLTALVGDAELVDTVGEEIDCGDGDHDRDDRGESGVEPVTLMGFHYFGRRGVPGRSGVGFSGRPMWSWWRRSARGESRATAPTRMGPCGAGRVNPATNRRLSGVPSRMVIEGQLLSSGD